MRSAPLIRKQSVSGGRMRGRVNFASGGLGTSSATPRTFVPQITEAQAKEAFSALVIQLTAKDLARASGRSIEAAKSWKDGSNFPSGVSLLNLARALPLVDEWVDEAKRAPRDPNELHARMIEESAIPGPQGDAARAYVKAWRRT